MKHTMKRALALLIALMLAVPTFALTEELDPPETIVVGEDIYVDEDEPGEEAPAEADPLVTAPEDDLIEDEPALSDEPEEGPFEAAADIGDLALT